MLCEFYFVQNNDGKIIELLFCFNVMLCFVLLKLLLTVNEKTKMSIDN